MCLSGPDLFRGPPLSWLSISPLHRKTISLSIHPPMNTKIDSYLGFPEVSHKHTSAAVSAADFNFWFCSCDD